MRRLRLPRLVPADLVGVETNRSSEVALGQTKCFPFLLAQGVPARVVMEVPGHSQIGVTMDLSTHVLPAVQDAAAAEKDRTLGPVGVKAALRDAEDLDSGHPGNT